MISILDSYSRYIVHWELALFRQAEEIAEITTRALSGVNREPQHIVLTSGEDNDKLLARFQGEA